MMGSDEIKSLSFSHQTITQMSSHTPSYLNSGLGFSKASSTKRKGRYGYISTLHVTFVLVLLHLCWSPYFYNLVLANPVEEEPPKFNAGSTGSLSFSINSPRQTDGSRIKENAERDKQASSSNDARKGIKVM